MSLGLYYDPEIRTLSDFIAAAVHVCLPKLKIGIRSEIYIPGTSINQSQNAYNVDDLLRYLAEKRLEKNELSVWILGRGVDIRTTLRPYVFGAATNNLAIVSFARLSTLENLSKEVCHEIGHMFGLGHCNRECIMQVSLNDEMVSQKPAYLCRSCANFIVSKF